MNLSDFSTWEQVSFYDVRRGDVLVVVTLAVSDAPESEDGMMGVLKVKDDSTTRIYRVGKIKVDGGA